MVRGSYVFGKQDSNPREGVIRNYDNEVYPYSKDSNPREGVIQTSIRLRALDLKDSNPREGVIPL